jgi:hypothetical protein
MVAIKRSTGEVPTDRPAQHIKAYTCSTTTATNNTNNTDNTELTVTRDTFAGT